MAESQRLARLHDEEHRAEFAIKRRERAMLEEEREMERAMRAFEEEEELAKRQIGEEWRREHWGREPERKPDWKK
jgi:hypothetical protein